MVLILQMLDVIHSARSPTLPTAMIGPVQVLVYDPRVLGPGPLLVRAPGPCLSGHDVGVSACTARDTFFLDFVGFGDDIFGHLFDLCPGIQQLWQVPSV